MLGFVSHGAISPDLSFYLSDYEVSRLGEGESLSGSAILNNERKRWSKKLSVLLDAQSSGFVFHEDTEQLRVDMSQDKIGELLSTHSFPRGMLAERCTYGEGSKITMKSLEFLSGDMIQGFSLITAGMHLAQEKGLTQQEERGLVEGLFEGINQGERELITEIYDI